MIGYLKGNAIRINDNQFPDIYTIATEQARSLGLAEVPTIYILQKGGSLNAFATRFFGRNFIVLYSDILETAYEKGNKAIAPQRHHYDEALRESAAELIDYFSLKQQKKKLILIGSSQMYGKLPKTVSLKSKFKPVNSYAKFRVESYNYMLKKTLV